jgi:hypothetical protein
MKWKRLEDKSGNLFYVTPDKQRKSVKPLNNGTWKKNRVSNHIFTDH